MSKKNIEPVDDKKPKVVKNTADYQRLKLEKLMKNPEKPVIIPEGPRQKSLAPPPDFVRNVMGSSAGAGSGEFHVYRHLRRKEYARQKFIQEKSEKEKLDDEYHWKIEENKRRAEEKTAKKREKRLKKKQRSKIKEKRPKQSDNSKQSESSQSESNEDSDKEDTVIVQAKSITSVKGKGQTHSDSTKENAEDNENKSTNSKQDAEKDEMNSDASNKDTEKDETSDSL